MVRRIRKSDMRTARLMLSFSQDEGGLKINLPAERVGNYAYVFRIEGLKLK